MKEDKRKKKTTLSDEEQKKCLKESERGSGRGILKIGEQKDKRKRRLPRQCQLTTETKKTTLQ